MLFSTCKIYLISLCDLRDGTLILDRVRRSQSPIHFPYTNPMNRARNRYLPTTVASLLSPRTSKARALPNQFTTAPRLRWHRLSAEIPITALCRHPFKVLVRLTPL
jgi:hypothetical protein